MSWLNEPPQWSDHDGVIRVVTGPRTDFWRRTFYGYVTDNGHFYHRAVTGDFTAEVTASAGHSTLFDQAGLMLRAGARTWLKTGLEVTSGAVQLSTVLTRDHSDLSVVPLPGFRGELRLRLTRFGSAVCVHRGDDDGAWHLVRLGHLDLPETIDVGVMCCSPQRQGLEVGFRDFRIGEPIPREGLEQPRSRDRDGRAGRQSADLRGPTRPAGPGHRQPPASVTRPEYAREPRP